jgi:hypothetical protein
MSDLRSGRRGHTRWALLTVLLMLAAIVTGALALDRAAPTGTPLPALAVELPPPLLATPFVCTRADERARIDEVVADLAPDGRLTSSLAFACPRLFDGRSVIFVGEVVGDVLRRDGGAWVQVNDDAYALERGPIGPHRERLGTSSGLAVWLPDGLHETLGDPGRYGRRGDLVQVSGDFLRADPADGGGMAVRARELELLSPSTPVTETLNLPLALAAGGALLLTSVLLVWSRRRGRTERSHSH